jgi:hypothetical protein
MPRKPLATWVDGGRGSVIRVDSSGLSRAWLTPHQGLRIPLFESCMVFYIGPMHQELWSPTRVHDFDPSGFTSFWGPFGTLYARPEDWR